MRTIHNTVIRIWMIAAALGMGANIGFAAGDSLPLSQAWRQRCEAHPAGTISWIIEQQDRSENFGLAPHDATAPNATGTRVELRWNREGLELAATCPPPADISHPRQIRERSFLGYAQIHHQYMDSLVVRFSRGQLNASPQPYSLRVLPAGEVHNWEGAGEAFPRAAICSSWQADECFGVPTLAWLADACRVSLGICNRATGPVLEVVKSELQAQVGDLSCEVWTSESPQETRIYWTDPARQQLIVKCFVQFPDGRPRRRYDYGYEADAGNWKLKRLTILQFTAGGGVHDKVALRQESFAQDPTTAEIHAPLFASGTLVSDFYRKAQWLTRDDSGERLTTVRDTVLRRTYADLASGSSPSSISRNWLHGFRPTWEELRESVKTGESLAILGISCVLFCLLPRRRRRGSVDSAESSGTGKGSLRKTCSL